MPSYRQQGPAEPCHLELTHLPGSREGQPRRQPPSCPLRRVAWKSLEPHTGFEPVAPGWKPGELPITPMRQVGPLRRPVEPVHGQQPPSLTRPGDSPAEAPGIEPGRDSRPDYRFRGGCLTTRPRFLAYLCQELNLVPAGYKPAALTNELQRQVGAPDAELVPRKPRHGCEGSNPG